MQIAGPTVDQPPNVDILTGDVELHDLNPPLEPGTVDVDIDFTPELGDNVAPNNGTFDYQLVSANSFFRLARLDSTCPLLGCKVEKSLFSDMSFSMPIMLSNGTNMLVSSNGAPDQSTLVGSYKTIYVRDVYSVDATGRLDNIANTFQTPGPLPVLGAGAAFGFSRKLRTRLKAARSS